MAAGLGFKTFTTGEVLTADDTNGYLMQGVLVFADSAARAAAITSPTEGQISFLKDTNTTQYYDGATYQNVSTTGGMTLISTTTLTGASVTLSSIPQTFNNLFLVIQNYKPATDAAALEMRFNADSAANRHRKSLLYTGTSYNAALTFNATSGEIAVINDNSVATGLSTVLIPDYTNATTWKMAEVTSIGVDPTTTTSFEFLKSAILYNQITAISSLSIFAASGNLTSGTVLLYGVK
jgi:hypothetical protein